MQDGEAEFQSKWQEHRLHPPKIKAHAIRACGSYKDAMLKKLLQPNVSIAGLTNVGDDDIIAFARMYADVPVAQQKNESDFMRDGLYYARGYLVMRNRGATHGEALDATRSAAEGDSRFD